MHERQWLIRNPILMVVIAIVAPLQVWAFAATDEPGTWVWFLLPLLLLGLLCAGFLSIRLEFGALRLAYFPIWRRTVPLADIVSATPVAYKWLEFGGWGLRVNRRATAYSVWSKQALELEIRGQRRRLVFTTNQQSAWLEAMRHAGIPVIDPDESAL